MAAVSRGCSLLTQPKYVVVPFSRPQNLPLVFASYQRAFACHGFALVLVRSSNGRNVSTGVVRQIDTDETNPGQVRNLGIEYVRSIGGGMIAFMDDDDIYFEAHAKALLRDWEPGSVVGHSSHFIRTRDERLIHVNVGDKGPVNLMPQTCMGHSDDIAPWRIRDKEREDPDWCEAMRDAGVKLKRLDSPVGFCFDNHPHGHAWAPPDSEWAVRADAMDLGPYDAAIVDGSKPVPVGTKIEPSIDDMREMLIRMGSIERNPFGAIT
jgi:glycosyltransferase involved in cell wall biosynthesis